MVLLMEILLEYPWNLGFKSINLTKCVTVLLGDVHESHILLKYFSVFSFLRQLFWVVVVKDQEIA